MRDSEKERRSSETAFFFSDLDCFPRARRNFSLVKKSNSPRFKKKKKKTRMTEFCLFTRRLVTVLLKLIHGASGRRSNLFQAI